MKQAINVCTLYMDKQVICYGSGATNMHDIVKTKYIFI